jgi:hypothetical protein
MRILECLKVIGGSLLLAALIYGVLAAPGLLTDTASTVPVNEHIATVQP